MVYIKALRKGDLPGSPVLKRKGEARNAQKQDVQTCAGWQEEEIHLCQIAGSTEDAPFARSADEVV